MLDPEGVLLGPGGLLNPSERLDVAEATLLELVSFRSLRSLPPGAEDDSMDAALRGAAASASAGGRRVADCTRKFRDCGVMSWRSWMCNGGSNGVATDKRPATGDYDARGGRTGSMPP